MDNRIAWAAGLFEGEGCITRMSRAGRVYGVVLTLGMKDEDVVRAFGEVLGVGKVRWSRSEELWRWSCGAKGAVGYVMHLFMPYLGSRRRVKWLSDLARVTPSRPYVHNNRPGRTLHRRVEEKGEGVDDTASWVEGVEDDDGDG